MDKLLIDLLETMEQAIESGDWKVDGACDPDTVMQRARNYLLSKGHVQNSIDGSWI